MIINWLNGMNVKMGLCHQSRSSRTKFQLFCITNEVEMLCSRGIFESPTLKAKISITAKLQNRYHTCAIPVTDKGTPCWVYTVGEATFKVIMLRLSLCTFWTQGITKAQPPTTINGCEWKHPETTRASLGPPVMKPMRHILLSFYGVVGYAAAVVLAASGAASWCRKNC